MSSRSAPTATTRAPYAGSAQASIRACRLVPAPETRTTRRVVTRRILGRLDAASALAPGHDQGADQATDAEGGDGGTSTSGTNGPTCRIRPGPTAPPATEASTAKATPATIPPPQPRSAASQPGQRRVPALPPHRRERGHQRAAATTSGRQPAAGRADAGQRRQQRRTAGSGPEHDGAGRDEGVAADREAGTEQEGAGEEGRVGQEAAVGEGVDDARSPTPRCSWLIIVAASPTPNGQRDQEDDGRERRGRPSRIAIARGRALADRRRGRRSPRSRPARSRSRWRGPRPPASSQAPQTTRGHARGSVSTLGGERWRPRRRRRRSRRRRARSPPAP